MICPQEIAKAFNGVKRCALCPYAIFSVNSIIRISAYKNKLTEDLKAAKIKLSDTVHSLSEIEKAKAEHGLKVLSEDVIHWYCIEEALLFIIEDESFIEQHKYLTGKKETVFEQIGRYEIPSESETALMLRLNQVETLPHYNSTYFTQQMNKLRSQILLQDGKFLEAITNPNPSLLPFELSEIIREKSSDPNFDLNEIIRLSNLPPKEYRESLRLVFNRSQTRLLE